MRTSGFKISFIFLFIFNLIGCSQDPLPEPSCRVNANYVSNHQGPGACVVRMNDLLLALKLNNGLYDLPISDSISSQSAQCSAHNEMWQQTGLNIEVEKPLGIHENGTWLFGCKLEAGFDGTEPAFSPTPWAKPNIEHIEFVDPFTLDIYNWHNPDQFIVVRDAYVAQGNYQKSMQDK